MAVDPAEQAAFIEGLRKKMEEASAKNPVLAELRRLGKAIIDETRQRIAAGQSGFPLGGYISADQQIVFTETRSGEAKKAYKDLVSALSKLAIDGKIHAAAVGTLVELAPPIGPVTHIKVHVEHVTGLAIESSVPADERELMAGVRGARGPALVVSGGKVKPIIFAVPN
jgi:hypothetical protein